MAQVLIVPLPKNTEGYAKGGLHWGPYGRSADENMENIGVSSDALDVARKHGANIARATTAVNTQTIFIP